MQYPEFKKYVHVAAIAEADRRLNGPEPTSARGWERFHQTQSMLRNLPEMTDYEGLYELTQLNHKSVHDALVEFLIDQHDLPARSHDCAKHDLLARTAPGGSMAVEVKYVTVRPDGGGTATNPRGAPSGMNLAMLVNDPSQPAPELLVATARVLRRIATTPPSMSGGWSISITRSKLEKWRQTGILNPFDDGIAQLRTMMSGGAARGSSRR